MLGRRVLVCGSRDMTDAWLVGLVLSGEHAREPIGLLIHGDQRGADHLARDWARVHGIAEQPFPAEWTLYGPQAGPIRNEQMAREGQPSLVIAFPSAASRGTRSMIKIAKRHGIEVVEYPC